MSALSLHVDEPVARRRHRAVVLDTPAQPAWDPADEGSVWAANAAGDRSARDHLLKQHYDLVRRVAGRLHARLGNRHELGDLIGAAVFGLIDAVEKYNPSLGHPFRAYATSRIRGAILDDVRANDCAPRSVRTQVRDVHDARAELEAALQRHPALPEIATHLGVDVRHLSRTLADARAMHLAALDEPTVHGMTLADVIAEPGSDPAEMLDRVVRTRLLAEALEAMRDDRVKLVLVLYYFERMPLADIGALLGVTESRACQLHRAGLKTLRESITWAEAA